MSFISHGLKQLLLCCCFLTVFARADSIQEPVMIKALDKSGFEIALLSKTTVWVPCDSFLYCYKPKKESEVEYLYSPSSSGKVLGNVLPIYRKKHEEITVVISEGNLLGELIFSGDTVEINLRVPDYRDKSTGVLTNEVHGHKPYRFNGQFKFELRSSDGNNSK
jgi:hypothetical protein